MWFVITVQLHTLENLDRFVQALHTCVHDLAAAGEGDREFGSLIDVHTYAQAWLLLCGLRGRFYFEMMCSGLPPEGRNPQTTHA